MIFKGNSCYYIYLLKSPLTFEKTRFTAVSFLLNLPLCYIFPQDIMNANKGKSEGNKIIETV